ncbi:hypothetical protein [Paenibacillus sp. DRB1-1]|uniref:hypothetical protein n=1 Tax=Paenibacillus sp. DRB1-1 TaxID=3422309 RepID=UPI003F97C533
MIDMSVKDMTDQQLNIALDVLLGAKVDRGRPGNVLKNNYSVSPTDYCADPVASLEVQAKAMDMDEIGYMANLVFRTGHSYSEGLNYETAADMLRATPRQRAEAAYMTLSSQD